MFGSDFNIDEVVICLINSRTSLVVGGEYKVRDIDRSDGQIFIDINGDKGWYEAGWYESDRFISKNDFRNLTINQILK